MARVKGKNTAVELSARRLVHRLGYRYRLHVPDLPGKPDLVFRARKKVIFVHGCFWHRHRGCKLARLPKSRAEFWLPKLEGNRTRDRREQAALRKSGWEYMIIWECQLRNKLALEARVRSFLNAEAHPC